MKIFIYKSERMLVCADGDTELLRAPVQLGFGAEAGPKLREGDGRTPEGAYVISSKNPNSRFHLALGISYPAPRDAEMALAAGVIDRETYENICRAPSRPPWDTPMGGFIMIHGQREPAARGDWTAGCIAIENTAMDALFAAAAIGDEVIIYP